MKKKVDEIGSYSVVLPDPDDPRRSRRVNLTRDQLLAVEQATKQSVVPFMIPASPLFLDMDKVALMEIWRRGRQRSCAAGSTIFGQGELADSVYIILAGKVKKTFLDSQRREWAIFDLSTFGPGDILGFVSPSVSQWPSTATAITDVSLLQMPRSEWALIMEQYPKLAINLAGYMVERLELHQSRFVQFAGSFTPQKIAMVLLSRAATEGVSARGTSWVEIPSPITHEEIASQIGTTREAVVGGMKKLNDVVKRDGKQYVVDVDGLNRFLSE